MFDQVIEAALPPKRAGDDFSGKRSVAVVLEMLAAGVKRGWQIGSAGGDRPNGVIRRGSRRRGHDCAKTSPGVM
jgi:hypothetical protein